MSHRMKRVNALLQEEIGNYLKKIITTDTLITVTKVSTSSDLRCSEVFISILGTAPVETILRRLERERSDLQRYLAKTVRLKYTPVLHFSLDDTFEKASRIDNILNKLAFEEDHEE